MCVTVLYGPRSVLFCPCRAAVAMGDNVSKRLKLVSATEAEMEERSFPNPYPDWDPGARTSGSGEEDDHREPFDAEGKVRLVNNTFTDVLIETRVSPS